jgi:hypothetical protein
MFRGEDTSQYQFDVEENAKNQTGKQKEAKKKRSIFGGIKKEKPTEEKVTKETVKTEKEVEKKTETMPKTVLKEKAETGKITKIAVACARCSANPVFSSNGTASIPPPPPKSPFANPTAPPQRIRFKLFFKV